VGGPVVHAVHGRPGPSFISLALRIALPLVGGLATTSTECSDGLTCADRAALGVFVGAGTAVTLDAAVLASEPSSDARVRAAQISTVRLAPAIDPGRHRGMVTVSGAF